MSDSTVPVKPESALASQIPSMTAGYAKSALGLLAAGLSDCYQTYDIAVGYHTATERWKIFIRMTTSEQPARQDEYKPVTSKCSLEVNLASEDPDPVFFEPEPENVDFEAELAALEQVTQIAMYKGTPFLLKCNGDVQERDCLALEAVLRIDMRGLDGVIERSKSRLWVPPF
ncbi:uncharacterized protein APUU_80797A [Aspergillus puulaauensis]|uniref:Uncharacterized protein n=1 Tax=Aspergillus puulaauensis TaxID=1220207 RepID=A0A7R7Y1L3_9EURO|nr:uncharacterized protein APUU_80797A [Aspergillus puulaauensis]BCS30494.1 hypothetical protein APUU_80797A [Aspergillus puulaauensis]